MPASVLNTATGVIPATRPAGTVAVSVKVMLPVRVSVPFTVPAPLQDWPIWPAQGTPALPTRKPAVPCACVWAWAVVRLFATFEPVTVPVAAMKPPPTAGNCTVIVAPCRMSPAVVPVQVVVVAPPTSVVVEQGNCSPAGLTVVGMKIVGVTPTSAVAPDACAVRVNTPEPVFRQVPFTAPDTVQVPPIVVVHGTPGVPEGGGGGAGPTVGLGVGVAVVGTDVAVPVSVTVEVSVGDAVAVRVGVAAAVAVAVAVAVALGASSSNAPMSHRGPCGRET